MDKKNLIKDQDIREEKIKILEEHFPGAIEKDEETGGYNLNTDSLLHILAPSKVKEAEDGYGLRWVGKKSSYLKASEPNRKLLNPSHDDSVKFDSAKNILIKGDNLDALKILIQNYSGKIKMIYIDPPYNRENDASMYKDNFSESEEAIRQTVDYDKDDMEYIENLLSTRSHSSWLTIMRARLLLARRLLREDGAIFINIDNKEIANLKLLCDEIWGQNNDILIWRKSDDGRYGKMKNTNTCRNDHDYIVVAFNNIKACKFNKVRVLPAFASKPRKDSDGRKWWPGYIARGENGSNPKHKRYYTVKSPGGKKFAAQFEVEQEEFDELNKQGYIHWSDKGIPYRKIYIDEKREIVASSIFLDTGTSYQGKLDLEELLGSTEIFDNPKPVDLIKRIIELSTSPNEEDIVLDFFAGSGTTAQAVMEMNKEDGGNRKFILVQKAEEIPSKTAKEREKHKAALDFLRNLKKPSTIFEICAERIRRAGSKIEDNKVDTGFRLLEVVEDEGNKVYDIPFNEVEQKEWVGVQGREIDEVLYSFMAADGILLDEQVECVKKNELYIVSDMAYIFAEIDLNELEKIKRDYPQVEYLTLYSPNIKSDEFMLKFEDHALRIHFDKSKIKVLG